MFYLVAVGWILEATNYRLRMLMYVCHDAQAPAETITTCPSVQRVTLV